MTKILDCTFRDGGYYTDWDFSEEIIDTYINAMNGLPIDYLEIGYRSNSSNKYLGRFGYTPIKELEKIRAKSNKKLAIMLNEKEVSISDAYALLKPIIGLVDMIRIAIDPINFERAIILARTIKKMGFEVGLNCMYMSKWLSDYPEFISKLGVLDDFADLFCMVDSYGGIVPDDLKHIYTEVQKNTAVPIGFHGHNNLQLSLINTITAIKLGVNYVDATILGMGRGAGNLNMELLLTYLNAYNNLPVDFNILGDVISSFIPLMNKYRWGTNLPYMIAGANKIPQKEVMDLVTNRTYSFNSVVRSLSNRVVNVEDNAKYPILSEKKYKNVIVVGGGRSPIDHFQGIKSFVNSRTSVALVFATARHAHLFDNISNVDKYYCLVGREAKRLEQNVKNNYFQDTCILPPYPRKLGTEVPHFAVKNTFELCKVEFTNLYQDSCTAIAIQTALNLSIDNIFAVGYDGYTGITLSEKELSLTKENRALFNHYFTFTGHKMKSLTPSLYSELDILSIYQFI